MKLRLTFSPCAVIMMLAVMITPAFATGICVNTMDCTLELNQGNNSSGFGSGLFGTVHMVDNGIDSVTVTVSLISGWNIVNTGFPGSFGFTDSLSGAPTIGNLSSSLYSGSTTDAAQDLHFDGFGYFKDAVATSGPNNGFGLQTVSFTVTQIGLNDVNYLLNLSATPAADGQVYFAVDAGRIGANTGLLGITGDPVPVPEPSYRWLFAAVCAIVWVRQRRKKHSTVM